MSDKEQFEVIGDGLLVRAPAKLNLSLLIAGKRPDGFHEIETIMAKVNFYDEILIEKTNEAGIELICKGPLQAPKGKDNLVYKAADMLLRSYSRLSNIKITLTKRIPAGAGLGSASSDAAATLIGLNKFLNLGLSMAQLANFAAKLGSDVAFFLDGPLAFCTSRGEKIKKLGQDFNFSALLILPDISVSTQKVYANYTHELALYKRLSGQINSLIEKNRIDLVTKICVNMLEKSCLSLYEQLADLKAKAESLGMETLCLTGSGSAMFWIFQKKDEKKADKYRRKLEKIPCKSIIVRSTRW
jgi:4-diphosphocytidyl-2-C-methyl-D-erythritol kinase